MANGKRLRDTVDLKYTIMCEMSGNCLRLEIPSLTLHVNTFKSNHLRPEPRGVKIEFSPFFIREARSTLPQRITMAYT